MPAGKKSFDSADHDPLEKPRCGGQFELATGAALRGGITTVSRIPNSMEVWWIGANGSIQAAYWYEGSKWERFTLAPAGSASTACGIAAVSRIPNSMELWWCVVGRSEWIGARRLLVLTRC
jgi:hypothetical protein